MNDSLELRHFGASAWEYYLDGRAIHADDRLELRTQDGWVSGRYEWAGQPSASPCLHINTQTTMSIRPFDRLRWPRVK